MTTLRNDSLAPMKPKNDPLAYLWPALLAGTIFLLSGAKELATPDFGLQFSKDKLAHFLVFGLLATSILRTPKLRACHWQDLAITILIVSGYGAFDEFRQSLTPGRTVELGDWIADTVGASVAVTAYARWTRYRKLLEWSPLKRKT